MQESKIKFIKTDFIGLLQPLTPELKGKWGLMNAQQMVEHVTDFFKISTARISFPLVSPLEQLPKLREFLWSDKEFRENTKGPESIIPAVPLPMRHLTIQIAIEKLEREVDSFFETFKNNTEKKVLHPVFGELNFEDWVQLHFKHTQHHAKQFDLLHG